MRTPLASTTQISRRAAAAWVTVSWVAPPIPFAAYQISPIESVLQLHVTPAETNVSPASFVTLLTMPVLPSMLTVTTTISVPARVAGIVSCPIVDAGVWTSMDWTNVGGGAGVPSGVSIKPPSPSPVSELSIGSKLRRQPARATTAAMTNHARKPLPSYANRASLRRRLNPAGPTNAAWTQRDRAP